MGGYDGMEGAANLSGLAALRTGVGKVYILNNSKKNNEIIFIKNSLIELKNIAKNKCYCYWTWLR